MRRPYRRYHGTIQKKKIIRHKFHNYAQPGYYFLTICSYGRQEFFSKVIQQRSQLLEYGKVVSDCWTNLNIVFQFIALDAFEIMPDHFHGILQLKEGNSTPLAQIIRNSKSVTTRKIRKKHRSINIWPDNYFDHVI